MTEYNANKAQEGFAAGKAFVLSDAKEIKYRHVSPDEEQERLKSAAMKLEERLKKGKGKTDRKNGELIDAEIMLLYDENYIGYARSLINKESLSAPDALKKAEEELCNKLRLSGSDYISERCADIRGLTKALTDAICNLSVRYPETPFVLVGRELSPVDIAMIDQNLILGIVTETGSPTSHVSVLAGNLDVPYLYGIPEILSMIKSDDFVILDADDGIIKINPSGEVKEEALKKQEKILENRDSESTITDAGQTKTRIFANIGGLHELEALYKSGAEGVGLVRSEFLFLGRNAAPSEEEQFETYRKIASAMYDKEIVIRTMDIGSDKQAEWLPMQKEPNPALGLRGLRVSLAYPELFRTQLRALFRAAVYGNLKIMLPMITAEWEIDAALEEMRIVAKKLDERGAEYKIPLLGVMIETPSAVMIAPELAKKVSFFSIGTNDLTQYTLALDRETIGLDKYYNPFHEAVFRLIDMTVKAAHDCNIPVAVCGELGGNPEALERLIKIGVDELSVSVGKVRKIKNMVAELEQKTSAAITGDQTGMKQEVSISDGFINAPCDGELIPMEEIPDQVFSSGLMGECIGIIPENGIIYAPVNGVISTIAKTDHAISFKKDDDEILVHIGIDTVKLNGEGFTLKVKEGEYVKQGQVVIEADMDYIRGKGYNPIVIVCKIQ